MVLFLTFSDYKHELKATSPQTGGQQSGGSLKSMRDKSGKEEKDAQEGSALKTAGAEGEITAGSEKFLFPHELFLDCSNAALPTCLG